MALRDDPCPEVDEGVIGAGAPGEVSGCPHIPPLQGGMQPVEPLVVSGMSCSLNVARWWVRAWSNRLPGPLCALAAAMIPEHVGIHGQIIAPVHRSSACPHPARLPKRRVGLVSVSQAVRCQVIAVSMLLRRRTRRL